MKEFSPTKEGMKNKKFHTEFHTELQRIATSFGIYGKDLEDKFLYSKVQSEVTNLKNKVNKLSFMNTVYKNKLYKYQISNNDTYIKDIENRFNKRIELLKKEIGDLNIISNRKDEELEYLKMRLKQEINKNEINKERKAS